MTVSRLMCFTLLVVIACSATVTAQESRWESQIAAFEQADVQSMPNPGVILFIGSSSIRMWESLADDMAPLDVINRGFGGSQIVDSIEFAPRIIFPYKPGAIVLYAGDNDIAAGKRPGEVFADFQQFVETVRAGLPDVPIAFISIKPSPSRWNIWPFMQAANRMIAHECARDPLLTYFDCATPMLNSNGTVRSEIFLEDMLHMNDTGYLLWTGVVKEGLMGVLK